MLVILILRRAALGILFLAKNLYRRAALGVLNWASTRSASAATKKLLKMAAFGAFGYWAGYSGLGTYYLFRANHVAGLAQDVKMWHTAIAPLCVWMFPALPYANGFVLRFLRSRYVNPFVFGLAVPVLYFGGLLAVYMLWAWTLPFYALWLVFTIVVAIVARPHVARAANALVGAIAADEAATIVRTIAWSRTKPGRGPKGGACNEPKQNQRNDDLCARFAHCRRHAPRCRQARLRFLA